MVLPYRLASDVATPHATSTCYLLLPGKSDAAKLGIKLSGKSLRPVVPFITFSSLYQKSRIMNAKTISLFTGIVIVVVITVAVTGYSGSLTGRWGAFQGLVEASETLRRLPLEIGDWKADKEGELDQTSINMLRIRDAYIYRSYKNVVTQEVVYLTMMVGPTGKVTVHTPEVCFGGKAYEKDAARTSIPINVVLPSGDEIADSFWKINFTGRSLDVSNHVSFYYAVSTGSVWEAVENPRVTFQTYRYVYKLQAEAFSGATDKEDTVKKFLTDCLPTIHGFMLPYK